ncbi:MAG: cytochrome C oxidase subunit III [Gammaproteobacteria bacterium SG8_47]|nr:MAG: cytochrome C oxidase subunit III [Gammaproteobacteria bacterium SG8_47]
MNKERGQQTVQTTGHSWDGDLQEFNNPLPRWWVWTFYATVVFAIIYWVLFPAWPVGNTFTKGVWNTITYETGAGEQKTTHWNTRALLLQDMQQGDEAVKQRQYMERVAAASYAEIAADPEMTDFVRNVAKGLFGDNCAGCHQQGGAGVVGLYPNLADDGWLWGGSFDDIHSSIAAGRNGFMPSFKDTFSAEQLDDVASYVLSLSGHSVDKAAAARGQAIFNGETGGCYYCHTTEATGLKSQGAANLTDSIWTIASVGEQMSLDQNLSAVKEVIRGGVGRHMPSWDGRLSETDIKILTFYVHELGGGK